MKLEEEMVMYQNAINLTARPRGTDSAKVIAVIETKALRGSGRQDDLCDIVTQYWDFNGNLLAEGIKKEKE